MVVEVLIRKGTVCLRKKKKEVRNIGVGKEPSKGKILLMFEIILINQRIK
jgi:hypothetical protein